MATKYSAIFLQIYVNISLNLRNNKNQTLFFKHSPGPLGDVETSGFVSVFNIS